MEEHRQHRRAAHQHEVVEGVHLGAVGARVPRPAEVHDAAGQAEQEGLDQLVQPVAGAVVGQVALERDDGEEAAADEAGACVCLSVCVRVCECV